MQKGVCLLAFCFLSLFCKSQTYIDTCLLLPKSIRAYISGTDTNQIKLSDIKKGFTLTSTDSSFKITSFRVGYSDASQGNFYLECRYKGNQYSLCTEVDSSGLHLNGAVRLFIDDIQAEKNNRCYNYWALIYKIIP
jgi:hypothetical protein